MTVRKLTKSENKTRKSVPDIVRIIDESIDTRNIAGGLTVILFDVKRCSNIDIGSYEASHFICSETLQAG